MRISSLTIMALMLLAGFMLPGCAGSDNGAGRINPFAGQIYEVGSKEVVMEFLYAEWCPHCAVMKPIVANLKARFPSSRFIVSYLEESDPAAKAAYEKYTANGYFQGYPTFVLNGDDVRVGEMGEEELTLWVCSKFKDPKPDSC